MSTRPRWGWFVLTVLVVVPARAADVPEAPYVLHLVATPEKVQCSKPEQFDLIIEPKAPWVLKTETPLAVTLSASPGLMLTKTELTSADIVDRATAAKTLRTGFTIATKGKHFIDASLSFFLCTPQICQRYLDQARRDWTVD
jgi:hypothetical protein